VLAPARIDVPWYVATGVLFLSRSKNLSATPRLVDAADGVLDDGDHGERHSRQRAGCE